MTKVEFASYDIEKMELIIEECEVPEMKKVEPASQADIYYKLRYTFEEDASENLPLMKTISKNIVSLLSNFMIGDKWTLGIECFKSGKVDAKPHLHLHFVSRTKKDTIVKCLKRSDLQIFNGNRCYSLGIEVIVNEDKFFRYPLKQQKNDTKRYVAFGKAFNLDVVKNWIETGYSCWIVACEISNAKRERKEDSDQLSDRLYAYLDKKDVLDSDLKIKVEILKFYVEEENKPINIATCKGYFLNYKLKRKLCSYEDVASSF